MAETIFPLRGKRVFVAGETGLVGKSLLDKLHTIDCDILSAPHAELDLRDAAATLDWIVEHRPHAIFLAAGKVGGIGANAAYPADFLHDNLAIAQSVIHGAHNAGVPRLLYLGSSCIYPKMAAQPIEEEALLTGPLEPTNEAYAIAKIAGLKMIEAYRRQHGRHYIAAMPTNLYGPYDRFDAKASHVIPALIEKFHTTQRNGVGEVSLWGTGRPLREFLYAPDLANALVMMMERYDGDIALNIGSGTEISIRNLAGMIADITGYEGRARFDTSQADGTPRKLLNSARMRALGWKPMMGLEEGLRRTCEWYRAQEEIRIPAARFSASSGT